MTRSVWMALGLWMSWLAAGFSADYVRVGALNIEHFGHPEHRQPVPAVAEYIYLSGVDVLALEEIYDTDNQPATRTNGKLDKVVEYLNGLPGQKWAYVLFAKKHAEETHQLTGIMWNQQRVSAVGEPFPVKPIDAANDPFDSWERAPQAMKFSAGNGKTDLVLIPVHMKSNLVPPEQPDLDVKAQRAYEARALAERLADVRIHFGNEKDIVILGDTNVKSATEQAIANFASAGFRDLNAGDTTTYAHGETSPFDRIFVPAGQPEFQYSRQYVLRAADPARHESLVSDHYLVTTAIRVLADDDP